MGGVGATFGVTYLLHKSDKLVRLASKIKQHTDVNVRDTDCEYLGSGKQW